MIKVNNTIIDIFKNDITKISDVDVIVNAANVGLVPGAGIDGAIRRAAGSELTKETRDIVNRFPYARLHTGMVVATEAYNIPCKKIFHAIVPIYDEYRKENNREHLMSCYYDSLILADQMSFQRIAFPAISTGIYGYPVEDAATVAITAAKCFLTLEDKNNITYICYVLFDDLTCNIFHEKAREILSKFI